MWPLILGLFLALLSALSILIQAGYSRTPNYELKRRARGGDELATVLYRAVAYGSSLQLLLWAMIGLSAAGSFVLLARALPLGVAFGIIALLVWLNFVWLAAGRLAGASAWLAARVTPPLAWFLGSTYAFTSRLPGMKSRQNAHVTPSDLYETEDMLALLEHQKTLTDNRIPASELDAAQRVLHFGHALIADALLPRQQMKFVSADDALGPVLLDELHDSGESSFVVYEGKKSQFIGTLNLHEALGAAPGARVRDVIRPELAYLNESQPLAYVLQAFRTTKQHVFVVVNASNDIVGCVTIEAALTAALGEVSTANFEVYDDRQAAAAYQFAPEPAAVTDQPDDPDDEPATPLAEPNEGMD